MTLETTPAAAKTLLSARKTADLITDFELTEAMPMSAELPIIRGWIMDELENRNPAAFWAWIDSNDESPRKFFRFNPVGRQA